LGNSHDILGSLFQICKTRDGIDQSESQKMAPISIAQQREALSKPVEQTQLTQVDLALKNSIFW
jgi:hypothetical protein